MLLFPYSNRHVLGPQNTRFRRFAIGKFTAAMNSTLDYTALRFSRDNQDSALRRHASNENSCELTGYE